MQKRVQTRCKQKKHYLLVESQVFIANYIITILTCSYYMHTHKHTLFIPNWISRKKSIWFHSNVPKVIGYKSLLT